MTDLLLRALLASALLLLPATFALACRCPDSLSPEQAYRQADAVVQARVLSVTGDINGKAGASVRLRTLKVWKRGVARDLDVATRTTCAYEFNVGTEYLIYLRKSGREASYSTKKCEGNLRIAEATEALQWLAQHGSLADVQE
jgi:hypothetical protein